MSRPHQHDVFIAYSHDPADIPRFDQIRHALEMRFGLRVQCDDDFPGDDDWKMLACQAIANSAVTLILWSDSAVQKDGVLFEALEAKKAGRVIHVRLDNASLPAALGRENARRLFTWGSAFRRWRHRAADPTAAPCDLDVDQLENLCRLVRVRSDDSQDGRAAAWARAHETALGQPDPHAIAATPLIDDIAYFEDLLVSLVDRTSPLATIERRLMEARDSGERAHVFDYAPAEHDVIDAFADNVATFFNHDKSGDLCPPGARALKGSIMAATPGAVEHTLERVLGRPSKFAQLLREHPKTGKVLTVLLSMHEPVDDPGPLLEAARNSLVPLNRVIYRDRKKSHVVLLLDMRRPQSRMPAKRGFFRPLRREEVPAAPAFERVAMADVRHWATRLSRHEWVAQRYATDRLAPAADIRVRNALQVRESWQLPYGEVRQHLVDALREVRREFVRLPAARR